MAIKQLFGNIDNKLIKIFGAPYLYSTRDYNIHERVFYLMSCLNRHASKSFRILDAGCGAGFTLFHLNRYFKNSVEEYIGFDLNARRLNDRYRYVHIPYSFHDIDIDKDWNLGEFDVIWCSEVIEHLVDDVGAIQKLAKSLRRDGLIIITSPSLYYILDIGKTLTYMMKVSDTQDGGHVRLGYRIEDIKSIAESLKLKIIEIAGIQRADLRYTKKRYESNTIQYCIRNIKSAITRTQNDHFCINLDNVQLKNYMSIGSVLKRIDYI